MTADQYTQLTEMLARQFARIDQRFDGIDRRLDAIEVRLDTIDVRLDTIEVRLDALEVRFHALELRVGVLESGFLRLGVQFEEFRHDMQVIAEQGVSNSNRITGLENRLN